MAEKYGIKTKELMVKEMKKIFSNNDALIFSTIEKIKASQIDVLRKNINKKGATYLVLKNKLAQIALKESGINDLCEDLKEKKIIGVGIVSEDAVSIVKTMVDFQKDNKGFNLSKGYVDGIVLDQDRLKELSELPSKEQLISMVLSRLNAPISNFVVVLSSMLRSLTCVLNAIKEQKESGSK